MTQQGRLIEPGRKLLRHGIRASMAVILAGVCLEVAVVVAGFLISEGFRSHGWLITLGGFHKDDYHLFNEINSMIGLFASLVLIYGILSFARGLRITRSAFRWVCTSIVLVMILKLFDVANTIFRDVTDALFQNFPFMDVLLYNVLILGGAVALLIGFMRALYDSNQLNRRLEEQNRRLDSEIRERKEAEGEIHARERQFSTILNALSSPVFLINREGYVLAHNRVFAEMWGPGQENLVGFHLRQLMPESTFETGKRYAMPLFDSERTNGYTMTVGDRTYEVNNFPVHDAAGGVPCVTVLALDVTEKLRDEEERLLLQAAVNSAAEMIIVTDITGAIEYVNPAFEELSGYTRKELEGLCYPDLGFGRQEDSFYEEVWDTILSGEVWRGHFINSYRNGKTVHENVTISPILDSEGIIKHFVTVKRDVTREMHLEQQLQQAQKLEALGTMAGGIAHDMNNVFSIILGHSELAAPSLEKEHPARESLDIIMKTATRSSRMVKRLLTFARKNPGETGPLYVASMIEEQVKFMHTYLPSNIKVNERVCVKDEIIVADPTEVQQAFVNLVNNANAAMQPGGGVLAVELEAVHLDAETLLTTGLLVPGDYLRLRICDTGCGMDSETQLRMFDPFFSTKPPGEGTGLGLPMVHGSVLRLGGQIDVESAPGRGTRIDLYWPQADPGTVVPVESSHDPVSGNGISVLVVDDMIDFLELLTLNLGYHGFKVNSFETAGEALQFFTENPDDTDIAVVDFMMPGMNGREVAQALHEIRPGLPVVLLSGYACGIRSENASENGFCAVFEKPLEMAKLTRTLVQLAPRQ